jgi:hypothetical protein
VVEGVNDPPVINAVGNIITDQDTPVTVPITISDVDTPASALVVSAISFNTTLVPDSGLSFSDPTSTDDHTFVYNLTIIPASGQFGTGDIRVDVDDQGIRIRVILSLTVNEVAGIATLPIPAEPGSGLNGRYWKLPIKSTLGILDNGEASFIGLKTIRGGNPDATFTATTIDYTGDDLTPLVDWLGADGASVAGKPGNLDEGLLSMTGWLAITEAGTVNFTVPSDDGNVVWIGDQIAVNNDGSHGAPGDGAAGSFTFDAPGLYPIEVVWFNGDWTDDAGAHGGASIQLTSDGGAGLGNAGGVIPAEKLYGSADIGMPMVSASNNNASAADNGAGLTGRYWQLPIQSILGIKNNGEDGYIGLKTMVTTPPAGHFKASGLEFTGDDLTPIVDWLNTGGNNDGDTYSGFPGNLDEGLISFNGYIMMDAGENSFNSSSDDGSVVWIGGVKVVDNDGSHGAPGDGADGTAFFPVTGLYPISVAWFNGDWTDDAGAHGGANITLTSNGESISADRLYQANTAFTLTGQDIGIEGDPVVAGSSDIQQDTAYAYDVDVTAGGSDIWGNDDSGHFVYTEWTGDFDASVEVTRLDVINQWSKAGLTARESLDTGSRHVWVNIDSAAETPVDGSATGANTYEMGTRVETDGGTSNWDENGGTPRMNVADSTLPAWLRLVRNGDTFRALRSSNGVDWTEMGNIEQVYPANMFVAMATTSHNNDGADFVTSAEYRNFTIFTPTTGEKEPPVLTISIDNAGRVTVEWTSGTLQSAPSPSGPWTDVTVVPGRGQPELPAESPFSEAANQPTRYYRGVD